MATRIAWLLNLDAELELQAPQTYRPSQLSAGRVHELVQRMADLIAPDDVILDADADAASYATLGADTRVQAFCATPSALATLTRLGLPTLTAPPIDVLCAVNDRAFCAQLGHGLPQSCFARDFEMLATQLARPSPTGSYVIKRAFSFAGREQRRVSAGNALDASSRGFCARSFERGEGVQVEPWVTRLLDVSRHGYVTRDGELLTGATREQRIDALGRFLGMSDASAAVSLTDADDAALLHELTRTGHALHAAGYFGPFGIDGFRYVAFAGVDPTASAFNPRCEINARFTMGYPRALLLDALRRL